MTNPIDPTEQRVREIITKYAGASSVETSPDRFSFITDQSTSEIMKIVREKDDLIATLKDCLHKGMTQEALFFMFDRDKLRKENQEKDERIKELELYKAHLSSKDIGPYLERQKAVEKIFSTMQKLFKPNWKEKKGWNRDELFNGAIEELEADFSHYQSLTGGKT